MRTNVKINLGLNVLCKRPDGFHELDTLFVPCDAYGDDLEIKKAEEFSIEMTSSNGIVLDWDPMKDLTVKAYEILKADFPDKVGAVKIRLHKAAPVGAGLGGGSADAAFALRMVSELFGLGLDDDSLAGYASRLGSDCAFFIYNRPMIGTGRGEILSECPATVAGKLKCYDLRVVIPSDIHVSTAQAYRGIVPAVPEISLRDALDMPVEHWKDVLHNDFETTVFEVYPALASLKQSLYDEGAVYAAMSGSGSAVFGLFKKEN